MKESHSLHLEDQLSGYSGYSYPVMAELEDLELSTEAGDLFEAFNSVTLHYDGES